MLEVRDKGPATSLEASFRRCDEARLKMRRGQAPRDESNRGEAVGSTMP